MTDKIRKTELEWARHLTPEPSAIPRYLGTGSTSGGHVFVDAQSPLQQRHQLAPISLGFAANQEAR